MKKLFVTIDNKEYLETFNSDAQCVFCEVIGAYRIEDLSLDDGIAFCEKCLKANYKHVREEV